MLLLPVRGARGALELKGPVFAPGADESEDDEPTQKRKRGGDKPKRRSRSSAASQVRKC